MLNSKPQLSRLDLLKLLGVAALYSLSYWAVLWLFARDGQASIFFLASGVALAALLIGGKRYVWAVLAGAVFANAMVGTALPVSAALAFGSTLAAVTGAWLIRRDKQFDLGLLDLRSLMRVIGLGGFAGSCVSAVSGSTALLLAGALDQGTYLVSIANWWMGDTLGVILITPLLLAWWPARRAGVFLPSLRTVGEAALILGLTTLAAGMVFLEWGHGRVPSGVHRVVDVVVQGYWMFLFVAWAALRLGMRGTTAALLLVATVGVAGAYLGTGILASDAVLIRLTNYWFYTVILSLVGMALASYIDSGRRFTQSLQRSGVRSALELRDHVLALDQHAMVLSINLQQRIISVNDQFCEVSGYAREELLGLDLRELANGLNSPGLFADMERTLAQGKAWSGEICNRAKDGHVHWLRMTVAPFLGEDGQASKYVAICADATARMLAQQQARRMAQLHASLSRCGQAIIHSSSEDELFAQVCRIAVESGGLAMAWVGKIDEPSRSVRMAASFGDTGGYLDGLEISTDPDSPPGQGPTAIALRQRRPYWCQSNDGDEVTKPWRTRMARSGLASSAALPLFCHGEPVAVLCLYATTPHFFDDDAQQLLDEMASEVSFALDKFASEALRLHAESALRDSESEARFALEKADAALRELNLQKYALDQHAIVATTDAQGKIRYANDRFCEVSGYSRLELLGQDHALLNSGVHPKGYFKAMHDCIAGGAVWHGEICNRAKDGRLHWLDTTVVPFMTVSGQPQQYIAIRSDTTARKQAEISLTEREEIFRSIVTQARDAIVLLDATSLRMVEFNDAACHMLGYSRDEYALLTANDIQVSSNAARPADRLQAILAAGSTSYETVHRCKDGQLRNVHMSVRVITLSARPYLVSVGTDITQRKANELELQRHRDHLEELVQEQTASLQHSMALTQLALSDLQQQKFVLDQHANVTITDTHGRISYCNPKFIRLSGYSAEELLGQDHAVVNSGHHPKGFFKAMFETIQRGEVWHAEVCNRAKDGHLFWVDTTVVAFMGEDGRPREYIAVRTDITERRRVEQAAHAANRAKSEFLANMSHEIRTPMNGVVGMVDILQETDLQPAQQRMLDTIHNSSLALLGILNDILDFSKIEAGKLAVEFLPTHLREVAEGVVQLLHASADTKGIELSAFVSPELAPWVLCDPNRLRQILLNLLGNAIKFSAERAGKVRLSAHACTLADGQAGVRWRVTDNGIGMGPLALDKLFQPFTQADASTARKFGGTGLGLSIAQRLVELLGGQISVRSALGEGAEFTVDLPLLEAQAGRVMAADPTLAGVQLSVVTSDTETAEIIRAYGTAAGAQVRVLSDMATACQLLSHVPEAATRCVLLLGLDTDEATSASTLPATVGVVRLCDRSVGIRADGHEVSLSARPLLCRELLQAVALAGGRFAGSGLAYPGEQRRSPVRPRAPSIEQALAGRRLILVAEDNAINREVLQEQLHLLGYASEMAQDGAMALAMWRSGRYGLLLTDCHMPNMDGFELTEAIRRNESAGQHLPIVAITANAMQGEAQRCRERGMDDYLPKPLRMSELGPLLAKWLPRPEQVDEAIPIDAFEAKTAQAPMWDPATLGRLVGENPGLHRRLLEKFLLHAQAQVSELDALAATDSCERVADVAHTLKSAARTVGALLLGELCQALETAGRSGDTVNCRLLEPDVTSAFEAAQQLIRQHLDGDTIRPAVGTIQNDAVST